MTMHTLEMNHDLDSPSLPFEAGKGERSGNLHTEVVAECNWLSYLTPNNVPCRSELVGALPNFPPRISDKTVYTDPDPES